MKKILFAFIMLFFITGCSPNYDITNNIKKEEIDVNEYRLYDIKVKNEKDIQFVKENGGIFLKKLDGHKRYLVALTGEQCKIVFNRKTIKDPTPESIYTVSDLEAREQTEQEILGVLQ